VRLQKRTEHHLQGSVRCASPPQAQWRGACAEVAHEEALTGGFSAPPSLLLENYVAHCKNPWVRYNYQTQKNRLSMFVRPK